MSTLVERAERKSRMRAIVAAAMAVVALALLIATFGTPTDTWRGFQTGLTAATLLYITPFFRWCMPTGLGRLIDDEQTQAHRRAAGTAGLVAAVISAFAMIVVVEDHPISASDTARVIMTAAVAAALFCFSTLELRAAR